MSLLTEMFAVETPSGAPSRAGHGVVVARASETGETVLPTTRASSPLRLVRPTFRGSSSAAVCVVTFGGGLLDGDEITLDLDVGAGSTLVVFTQASTKAFRGASKQTLRATVRGTLVLLPDPVAAFSGSRYTQRVDVDLVGTGACVLLDGFTSGRAAYGERWAMRGLDLRTRLTLDGSTIVNDALRLEQEDGAIAERTSTYDAFATLIALGDVASPVAQTILREEIAPPTETLAVASSPLPRADRRGVSGAIARVAASSPERALEVIRVYLRNLPKLGAVDPFTARY